MNFVLAAEASLDRIFFFFVSFLFPIQNHDVLLKLLPHLHVYVQFVPPFPGSVLGLHHFPLKVVSQDENQASWTSDSGTSRAELTQMVFLEGLFLLS